MSNERVEAGAQRSERDPISLSDLGRARELARAIVLEQTSDHAVGGKLYRAIVSGFLEQRAEEAELQVQQMGKRVWNLDEHGKPFELLDGAVPCGWLLKRAADLRRRAEEISPRSQDAGTVAAREANK